MNKATLNKYWQDPSSIQKEDLPGLKSLVDQYPYAVAFKQLLCKGLYLHQDFEFEKYLKITALQTSDRAAFRKFLLNEKLDTSRYLQNESSPLESTPLKVVETKKPEEKTEDEIVEISTTNTSPKDNSKKAERDPLEDLIMAEAISASIAKEVEPNPEDFKKEERPIIPKNEKMSMTGWLNALEGKSDIEAVKDDFYKKAEAIIDQFLASKPKIVPRNDFYSAENKAKSSATFNKDIVSETLVKIYMAQGHYNQALEGCEQLILRFPEKKSYFAGLIQEVKELQNKKA
jgi:hypothetical protein